MFAFVRISGKSKILFRFFTAQVRLNYFLNLKTVCSLVAAVFSSLPAKRFS